MKELKDHKLEKTSCQGTFKCEECDACYNVKERLEEHMKIHVKYPCDDCDKIFNYEATLEKHVLAAHEDLELYCHFFNNDKEAPMMISVFSFTKSLKNVGLEKHVKESCACTHMRNLMMT